MQVKKALPRRLLGLVVRYTRLPHFHLFLILSLSPTVLQTLPLRLQSNPSQLIPPVGSLLVLSVIQLIISDHYR